jgi:hypothetical protein|tara:strand:- start:149 stop:346 length:198 start_codon:yes stop_codon:yes gene_type:complete
MAEYRRVVLPVATPEYNSNNEQVSRATVTQTLEEMQSDIAANTKKTSKESSLALRRFQFLLMGAS